MRPITNTAMNSLLNIYFLLNKENIDYKGFIYIGLMNVLGNPYVIEYNVRMGDPETEVVFPRIKTDLVQLLKATARKELSTFQLELDERSATTVVLVSGGYPEAYEKGKEILGLDQVKDSVVFHAGTEIQGDKVVSSGGRVLAVTSYGADYKEALKRSYDSIQKICFDKINYRRDIGFDL